jgi:hypothetical protein
MPKVLVRASGVVAVTLRPGESLVFGRAPHAAVEPGRLPGRTVLALPDSAPHVSRLVGTLRVGAERVVLTCLLGTGTVQLAGMFEAPGGARRVSLTRGMTAPLDDGENQLVLPLGRQDEHGDLTDLVISIDVTPEGADRSLTPDTPAGPDGTAPGPRLVRGGREWFVALALAEPWLTGRDDYPRPPSNREICERVRGWHGYAWNLDRPQRVDEAIRSISALAFGVRDDPYLFPHEGRLQNLRFAVAQRAAELRLVTAADLADVERAARNRKVPPPQASSGGPTRS